MQIIKKEAEFEEVKIGYVVELLEGYLLIKKGSLGKVVEIGDDRIKVEFPMFMVGRVEDSPADKDDRFIYAKPVELKFIDKGINYQNCNKP